MWRKNRQSKSWGRYCRVGGREGGGKLSEKFLPFALLSSEQSIGTKGAKVSSEKARFRWCSTTKYSYKPALSNSNKASVAMDWYDLKAVSSSDSSYCEIYLWSPILRSSCAVLQQLWDRAFLDSSYFSSQGRKLTTSPHPPRRFITWSTPLRCRRLPKALESDAGSQRAIPSFTSLNNWSDGLNEMRWANECRWLG